MKNLKKTLTILLLALLFGGIEAYAQNTAAPYLSRATTASGEGYGGAYTALANDASATYWNPAGLAGVTSYSFTGMYSAGLAYDRVFNTASLAYNLGEAGVIGIGFINAGVNDIMGYDEGNNQTGTFNNVNMAIGASYAFSISEALSVGVTGKYLSQDLDVVKDEGYAMDLGVKFTQEQFMVGATYQNLLGELGPDKLPHVLRAGLGLMPIPGLTAAVDLEVDDLSSDQYNAYLRFGAGYDIQVTEEFSIGVRSGMKDTELNFGGNIGFSAEPINFSIDYAYAKEPNFFGASHRIGLSINGL
mgnify:FL=1